MISSVLKKTNIMNKAEFINKLLWLGYTSAEEGKEKRKEAVSMAHNLLDEYLKAINYTRCCKSDSELLKVLGEHIAEQFDHKAEDVIEQLEWKFKNL
mgnify:CR=1 FL=1|jgi:Mn-dependent DtxR family transcriptional regulator